MSETDKNIINETIEGKFKIEDDQNGDSKDNIVTNLSKDNPVAIDIDIPLSKRQIKKLRKVEEWQSKKKIKRLKEREKYRQKRLVSIARGEPVRKGPSRKELKRNRIDASQCKYTIAVDLSFDELMIDKDIGKCVKQLLRVYTINRRALTPLNLYFTGVQEGTRLHKTLERNDGYKNWDVQMTAESFRMVFALDKIVYLTSDSDNVLDELDENKIYVIGGLVDHNHNKGLCHKIAVDGGISHARLPLNENVLMKTRTVLSIFHVFEILLKKSQGETWQDAILHVIPQRKGATPKCSSSTVQTQFDNDGAKLECTSIIHKKNVDGSSCSSEVLCNPYSVNCNDGDGKPNCSLPVISNESCENNNKENNNSDL